MIVTRLAVALSDSDITITFEEIARLPMTLTCIIRIDNEHMSYNRTTGVLGRAYNGTEVATHEADAPVDLLLDDSLIYNMVERLEELSTGVMSVASGTTFPTPSGMTLFFREDLYKLYIWALMSTGKYLYRALAFEADCMLLADLDDTLYGTNGEILKAPTTNALYDSFIAHMAAADPHTVYMLESLLAEQGDIIYASAASTAAVLTHGNAGDRLKSGGHGANPSWITDYVSINFIIDGGGAAVTTGQKGHVEVPFACTIVAMTILADQSGSAVVDIWKDTYANFPPADADSITSATPPTLSSATKAQDTTLTNWTTAVAAGDILAFNVDSCTTCTRLTISLKVKRT